MSLVRPLSALPLLALAPLVGCAPAPSESGPSTELTWYADIKPIVETHCTRCHSEGGQGVGDFTDEATVFALAERMAARVDAGEMPPPVADPSCRDYEGSEHLSMPQERRALLREWVDGGAPQGDPGSYVAPDSVVPQLDSVDLTVQIETPYQPSFSDAENPGNEYRCFVMEHGQTEDFFVTAMRPLVDSKELVHHIVLFKMPRDEVWQDYDPELGIDCIDGTGGAEINGMIAGWAPGALPIRLDDGLGLRVNADEVLVMQMHYFQSGAGPVPTDQSGYEFTVADAVETQVRMLPAGMFDFAIPAGEESHTETDGLELPDNLGLTVYGTFPHMHVLGSSYRVWAEAPDGVETCAAQGDYDFDNQLTYMFKEPMDVAPGSKLNIQCTWNNSASNPDLLFDEPVDTYYGERTDEEMCFAFTLAALHFE